MDVHASSQDSPTQFFAGSDDEEQNAIVEQLFDSENGSEPNLEPLFIHDSEDDAPSTLATRILANSKRKALFLHNEDSDSDGTKIPNFERSLTVQSKSSDDEVVLSSPPNELADPHTKKRRLSHSVTSSYFNQIEASSKEGPSGGSSTQIQPHKTSYYLGCFIIGNAWATVKGHGYIKAGDEILIEREDQVEKPGFKNYPSNSIVAKSRSKESKDKGKSKQLTLVSMMKSQPSNLAKKKVDTIVRLTNIRGFGQ
jgi:DNA repair protein RAD5